MHYIIVLLPRNRIFWPAISCILTGEIWRIYPYSVRMQEIANQKNSEFRRFSRIVNILATAYDC